MRHTYQPDVWTHFLIQLNFTILSWSWCSLEHIGYPVMWFPNSKQLWSNFYLYAFEKNTHWLQTTGSPWLTQKIRTTSTHWISWIEVNLYFSIFFCTQIWLDGFGAIMAAKEPRLNDFDVWGLLLFATHIHANYLCECNMSIFPGLPGVGQLITFTSSVFVRSDFQTFISDSRSR